MRPLREPRSSDHCSAAARTAALGVAHAEVREPVFDDAQVLVLVERPERHPQPEALGQRYLLLDPSSPGWTLAIVLTCLCVEVLVPCTRA
jgi:hypothetical protein